MTQNREPKKNILDNFIEKELEIKPNPFLAAKVMDKIATQNNGYEQHVVTEKYLNQKSNSLNTVHSLVFKFAMATSAAAILALGVFLGSNYNYQGTYNTQENNAMALNINDSQLENLYLYNVED